MTLAISEIYRHPVKSLTAERLETVTLKPGEALPNDRRFGIAHASAQFDALAPAHLKKSNFLTLVRNDRLAALETHFDDATDTLTILRDGKQVTRGQLTTPVGRSIIEQFFASFAAGEVRGTPKLLEGKGFAFTDQSEQLISLIGHASVSDLERVVGEPVDHRRFRANFYFTGGRPWEEFSWVGREITIGGLRFRVEKRIERCAATNINPETAKIDLNIPLALRKGFAHLDMGVYLRALDGGVIGPGAEIDPG
jgi:hypothetical protein